LSDLRIVGEEFCGAEVDDAEVAVGVDGCVLGFEVAVYDGFAVEVLDAEVEAGEVELGRDCVADAQL
jgi:hypothetical protein